MVKTHPGFTFHRSLDQLPIFDGLSRDGETGVLGVALPVEARVIDDELIALGALRFFRQLYILS